MKLWRILLAIALMVFASLVLFCAGFYMKIPSEQVFCFFAALLVEMVALNLAQDDGAKRRKDREKNHGDQRTAVSEHASQ